MNCVEIFAGYDYGVSVTDRSHSLDSMGRCHLLIWCSKAAEYNSVLISCPHNDWYTVFHGSMSSCRHADDFMSSFSPARG